MIADTYRSTLYPGGILNSGFALGWAKDRVDGAKPAARQWARDRIAGGDTVCAENQKLRLQARDLLAEIRPDRFYEAAGDALAPRTFVDKINVPVYLAGQFQDEQTGGHMSTMVPEFAPSTKLRVTLTNGTHVEPLGPEQITRLVEFVDFYVGKRKPVFNPLVRAAHPHRVQRPLRLLGRNRSARSLRRLSGLRVRSCRLRGRAAGPRALGERWRPGSGRALLDGRDDVRELARARNASAARGTCSRTAS